MIAVGTPVPPLERRLDAPSLVAYAGATWDWHRLHYDHEYYAARGLERPIVDGQLFGALLAETVLDWLGADAFVQKLSFRFKQPVMAGETVRCEGEVVDAGQDTIRCELRVVVAGDDRVAVAPASAEIRIRPQED